MLNKIVLACLAVLSVLAIIGCSSSATRDELQKRNESIMERAIRAVPVPEPINFLSRQAVAKWIERQDTPNRVYYVYALADTGNIIGYYVAQSRPINTCSFLTPPDRREHGADGAVTLSNPGLDGIFYGSSGCNQYFFFDASTDAMIELTGLKFFSSDQPLQLDAEPILVQAESTE